MEEIGVMAVIEGLQSFLGGMDKIQSAIERIRPPASLLQDAFGFLSDAAGNFASFIGDTLTFALGGLLTDAIQGVVSWMGEMISKTIDAGNEFQTLKLRLNGINLDALIKSGDDYATAQAKSIELTKEQLNWTQLLAIATPYDNKDISSVYSLARSYGFADDAARGLTEDTANFASAMGLSGEVMDRIIINLGQMKARGKITGGEMKDLARGAFLPLDDVLGRVAKSMGITVAALTKQISKPGEGVPAQAFIDAFQEMVQTEPRFVGAAERMARTFKAASDNFMDLITSFGGLDIVAKVLDVLGGKVADFMDQFSTTDGAGRHFTELGQRLLDAATSIGDSLSGIVSDLLGMLPSTDDLANGLVSGLENFASWLKDNKPIIVQGIQDIWTWLTNLGTNPFIAGLIGILQEVWHQLTQVLDSTGDQAWVDFVDAIGNVGSALGEVLLPILDQFGIHLGDTKFDMQGLIDGINQFADWIRNNKDLLQFLVLVFIQLEIIQTISNLVIGFIATMVALVAGIVAGAAVFGALLIVVGLVIAIVTMLRTALIGLQLFFIILGGVIAFFVANFILGWRSILDNATRTINDIVTAWNRRDWGGIGSAIINGIIRGIQGGVGALAAAARSAALSAYQSALNVLGIHSPSTLFAGVGENIMAGMAKGITDSAGVAVAAMQGAVAAVSMPALSAPSLMQSYAQAAPSAISNTYQSSNSYNLSINSSASPEPVIQDFNMLQSLAGA